MALTALPFAHWDLDSALTDATGGGRTLTSASGSYVTGKIGNARNGVWSRDADTGIANLISGDFSVNLWAYLDSSYQASEASPLTLNYGKSGTGSLNMTVLTDTADGVALSLGAYQTSFFTGTFDAFVMLTFVRSGTTAYLYHNGTLLSSGSHGGPTGTPSSVFNSAGDILAPITDAVSVFNYALTGAEVTYLYNSGAGRAFADMSTGGGAGARFAGSLFLLGVGN